MRTYLWPLVLIGVMTALTGCSRHWSSGTQAELATTVKGSGTPGAVVTGHYIHNGERVAFTNNLPFSVTLSGLSEIEVRKVRMEDKLELHARRGGVEVSSVAALGAAGLRVRADNHGGLEIQTLFK